MESTSMYCTDYPVAAVEHANYIRNRGRKYMKKYLITGCAGFIGSNFVYYMLKKYDDILLVNLDKLTYAGNLENLKGVEGDSRHVFVQGDICDKELVASLFEKYDFDYVINFAAESMWIVPLPIRRFLCRPM